MERDKHDGSFTDALNVIKFQPKINKLEEKIFSEKYQHIFGRNDARVGKLLAKRDSGQILSVEDEAYLHFRLVRKYPVNEADILAKMNSGYGFSIEKRQELKKRFLEDKNGSHLHYFSDVAELEVKKDLGLQISVEDELYIKYMHCNGSRIEARMLAKRDLGQTTPFENAYLKYFCAHYPSNIANLCAKKECGYKITKKEQLLVQLYENEFNRKLSNLLVANAKGDVSSVFDIIFLEWYSAGTDKHIAYGMAVKECREISQMIYENNELCKSSPFREYEVYAHSFMRPMIHDGKIRDKVNKMMKRHISIAK